MADYWIDSSVFIEGKKGPYAFDIAPRFWTLLDDLIAQDMIACPITVYDELQNVPDELRNWARARRESGLFVDPGIDVQVEFARITEHVRQGYPNNQATRRFLDCADPWVIAHAIAERGTVVSLEERVSRDSQQVRIPNICNQLNTCCINTYEMLRELGVSWNS